MVIRSKYREIFNNFKNSNKKIKFTSWFKLKIIKQIVRLNKMKNR